MMARFLNGALTFKRFSHSFSKSSKIHLTSSQAWPKTRCKRFSRELGRADDLDGLEKYLCSEDQTIRRAVST